MAPNAAAVASPVQPASAVVQPAVSVPLNANIGSPLEDILTRLHVGSAQAGPCPLDSARIGKRQKIQLVPQGFIFWLYCQHISSPKTLPEKGNILPIPSVQRIARPVHPSSNDPRSRKRPNIPSGVQTLEEECNRSSITSGDGRPYLRPYDTRGTAQVRNATGGGGKQALPRDRAPATIRNSVRRRGNEHRQVPRASVGLAIRKPLSLVRPHGHSHVRPYRRCDDATNDSREKAHRGNQSTRRITPLARQQRTQAAPPKLPQQREPSPGAAVTPEAYPVCSASTFPIPSHAQGNITKAADVAIESLNMLFFGLHGFPLTRSLKLVPPKTPARKASAKIYRIIQNAKSQSTQGSQHTANTTANLAALPSYQHPELSSIFDDPDLASERGSFKQIRANEIDLPPPRPPPKPAQASLWINHLPQDIKSLFTDQSSLLTDPLRTRVSSPYTADFPPSRVYAARDSSLSY